MTVRPTRIASPPCRLASLTFTPLTVVPFVEPSSMSWRCVAVTASEA
jgi:hypothetical protein